MKEITIIMPFLNEGKEPEKTLDSIFETANQSMFEVIAIDDGSNGLLNRFNYNNPNVRFIKNKKRIGVDACRQLGAELAKTPYLFIVDAHMRFPQGWMDKILDMVSREPKTLWCTTCLVLGYGNMDILKAKDKYYGASFQFINEDCVADRPAREILEPKWIPSKGLKEYEIPCILGANYAMSREWFHYLHGLKGLKMWGTSEPFLSIKSWMAGGKCKISTEIEIGHKFRDSAPYSTGIWNMIYNKLYLCKTVFPEELSNRLMEYFQKDGNYSKAIEEINRNSSIINAEKEYYKSIFTDTVEDFCSKFQIEHP